MRICILVGQFPPGVYGGAEVQAEQWARRLAGRHDVTVVTRARHGGQPLVEARDGFRIVRTPMSPVPGWRAIDNVAAIVRAVRRMPDRPDVVLCFQTFVSGLAGVLIQARTGVPALVWIRGELEYRLSRSRKYRLISPRVWARSAGVLVQSASNRAALLDELRRLDPRAAARLDPRIDIVPNGIEPPELPVAPGGRDVVVLGRLIRAKGVDTVIEAVAGTGARLVVAGDGPERAPLEDLARRVGTDAWFPGFVPRDELPELFAGARCVVMASREGEGFPNVLLEAMAWGVPVIATPVAGIADLVEDGHNGLSVPMDDPVALRAALDRLLRGTPEADALYAALRSGGRATAASYDWDRLTVLLETTIRKYTGRPVVGKGG